MRTSLLTKSWAGDVDAFAALCDSIERHAPDLVHHVVIDRADAPLFARFASARRPLHIAEELLPGFRPFRIGRRRLWWRRPRHVVRGWIFQQLAKIALTARLDDDAVIVIDSDVVLLRPLDPARFFIGGKVALHHRPGARSGPAHQSDGWHQAARTALGLGGAGYTGADYISHVIAWSPAVMRAMQARIEAVTQERWHDHLLRYFRFSECVLYGVFCRHVGGPHQALVSPVTDTPCHSCWGHDLSSPEGTARFVAALPGDKVAALVQSNLHLPAARRADIYAALRAQAAAMQRCGGRGPGA